MGVDENKAIVQRFLEEVVGRGDMWPRLGRG